MQLTGLANSGHLINPLKTMTDFNSATHNQNFVRDIEADAELSLDQLAEISGSGCFDFMIKAMKFGGLASVTGFFGHKAFNKYFKFLKAEKILKLESSTLLSNIPSLMAGF